MTTRCLVMIFNRKNIFICIHIFLREGKLFDKKLLEVQIENIVDYFRNE